MFKAGVPDIFIEIVQKIKIPVKGEYWFEYELRTVKKHRLNEINS